MKFNLNENTLLLQNYPL